MSWFRPLRSWLTQDQHHTCKRLRSPKRRQTSLVPQMESLERRYALATLVSATKLTYQDADGDNVSVVFSKPILNAANVNDIFTFDSGAGAVNGSNVVKEQLEVIDLTGLAAAAGTAVTTKATASAVNGGDGFAALGDLRAFGLDLGAVTIDGDLGQFRAGDNNLATSGLKGLTAQ